MSDPAFTPLVRRCAAAEGVSVSSVSVALKRGRCVVPANRLRKITRPCAIGHPLSTKVNVNLGSSTDKVDLRAEMRKLQICETFGADTVMDLSVGGDLKKIRLAILDRASMPVGTVPVYEAALRAKRRRGSVMKMEEEEILDVLQEQAEQGVDFFTIHCGINKRSLAAYLKHPRLLGIVSRGGAILIHWMLKNKRENPYYEHFDRILSIALKYRLTLSLGDGMRPGSVLDATDHAQLAELKELGQLVSRCRSAGVQVMVEGPGHVPLHEIQKNMEMEKKVCDGAPFYVLGPLVTDVAAGYDHIAGAIGAAIAARSGADFLCFLTPAEHLRHPTVADTREGLIASQIAAHAADLSLGRKAALARDRAMSLARRKKDWQSQLRLALDPQKARQYRQSSLPRQTDVCTMCGDFCSIKMMESCLNNGG